ncbi:hypothetical protein [Marinomonas posidonica]|uniref:Uncharacterized protein n=1 Tax=Marinomonas posidonica (strain CECT 7376 / NCIMB 14433 / IVIA-Po-181) TaxID=491952 RepID=F6CWR1_MARPP|nr:hypothetical protein [Marinomonas posidonica]AEF54411.1 hypothetical protein Mar181_1368 [Marinomonas posidonica IVIA-Po-181]
MMIVDLIDEVDFKERLKALEVPVHESQSMAEVKQVLLKWLVEFPEQRPNILVLFKEMQEEKITVLPEVLEVISSIEQ